MKKITFLLFCMSALIAARAQQPVQKEKDEHDHEAVIKPSAVPVEETLKLKETEFDFSKIPQGKPVYHFFEITNISQHPLKLDNVQASCGCTTPEWSREPVAPGATAKIRIGYNAAAEGFFEKYITITYNNSTQTKQIKIKGTVWKAPDGPAPVNASVDLLKKQSY
ncbi:MAG: DUF1573 domain-containing protein [Sphingobacteriales bacterium]|nr:DUF1573 domain-containing protein [Sphingobacteriales bacterium]